LLCCQTLHKVFKQNQIQSSLTNPVPYLEEEEVNLDWYLNPDNNIYTSLGISQFGLVPKSGDHYHYFYYWYFDLYSHWQYITFYCDVTIYEPMEFHSWCQVIQCVWGSLTSFVFYWNCTVFPNFLFISCYWVNRISIHGLEI
jgi:hypothetical protein